MKALLKKESVYTYGRMSCSLIVHQEWYREFSGSIALYINGGSPFEFEISYDDAGKLENLPVTINQAIAERIARRVHEVIAEELGKLHV